MSKKIVTQIGPKIRNVRKGRKISRKELADVCHPNTLRNFEIGLNQINLDDFVKLLIELGYTDFDLLDGLETSTLERYREYIEIVDCFTMFRSMESKNVVGIDETVLAVCMKIEAYLQTEAYKELDTIFKQDLYRMYLVMSNYLKRTTEAMFVAGLELFNSAYKKGQIVFSSAEVNLIAALCEMPYEKDKFFYKRCDKICDFLADKSRLKGYEVDFLYTYVTLMYNENNRKFNASKQKMLKINPCSQFVFETLKKCKK